MPRVLPLYPERPLCAVEREPPRAVPGPEVAGRDRCNRCSLHKRDKLRTVCMRAEGDPGGLLVVSDYPGAREDNVGRPFVGETGRYLRPQILKWWKGPLALDNAVKCCPGGYHTEEAVVMCRTYLAQTLLDAAPTRVLAMGGQAILGVTGRSLAVFSVRRGYTWLGGPKPIPVFFLPNPVVAISNRFLRQNFEADLEWALTCEPSFAPPWNGVAKVVMDETDALEADRELRAAPWFSYDVESAGRMWCAFQVLCASLSPAGSDDAWVWDIEALADPACCEVLARLLCDPKARKTGSNIKFDQLATEQELGVRLRGVMGDTRLLRKILDADADADLETMAELVGCGGHKEEAQDALVKAQRAVLAAGRSNVGAQRELISMSIPGLRNEVLRSIHPGDNAKTYAYGFLPREVRTRYNARDAVTTGRLQLLLDSWRQRDNPNLTRIYESIVLPAAEAVRQVEAWGTPVSRPAVAAFKSYLQLQKVDIMSRLEKYGKFNPEAHGDVSKLLFETLKLPPQGLTGGGKFSADVEALEALKVATGHPIVDDLLAWRKVSKMDGTYATGMERHIRDDGRIHPSILLDGARSGRPSCQDPNMQTIPRDADSDEGKMARSCFAAPPGWVMASLDYSQLELRVAAFLSQDPEMMAVFARGEDLHQRTAEWIAPIVWHIKPEEVKKPHRSAAKAFNFGILYGMGDEGIAARAGCTVAVAQRIREAVLGRFKRLDVWIKERLAYTKRTGYAWTWWAGQDARRRPLFEIADRGGDDHTRQGKARAEHSSWNTPIQGTGSEFLVASMIEIVNYILDNGLPAMVCLPVHDSLLMQIREDVVDEVLVESKSIMTSWDSAGVPVTVDVEVGPSWGDLVKRKT